jgi:hypothetical protein
MHYHLPIILRFSLCLLIALLTMSERVSKRSGSDSLLPSSTSHSKSLSSSSSSPPTGRSQEVYRLRARQFIADHGKTPREDVIQALLADPAVFLHCDVADARTIWTYTGITAIVPNQHNRKECISVLRTARSGKDEAKLEDDTGDQSDAQLQSASSSDQQPDGSDGGRRSSIRQRAREERSEPIFDACIRLHERGDPIPPEFLSLLTSQQRAILRESGAIDAEDGDTFKRRRAAAAKSSRAGLATDSKGLIIRDRQPKSIPRGLSLVAPPSSPSSSDPDDDSSDSSSSSSTVDSSSPSSGSSNSRRRRHRRRRHAAKRHKLSSSRHQLVSSSASDCPRTVRKYFEAHGSASKHSYTGEVERMLATQSPTQFWLNFCAMLSKDRRSQNEGLVLAMALEVVQYPDILTELLSRRLFGLWHFLRNDDWDLANALLPLGGAALLNAKVQQELNTHRRRAAKVSEHRTTASRSFRSNRYGAGRQRRGNDSTQQLQRVVGQDDNRDRRAPPRHSSGPSSSASAPHRRQSGAAPAQNDQRSSAAGGSGAGHT